MLTGHRLKKIELVRKQQDGKKQSASVIEKSSE